MYKVLNPILPKKTIEQIFSEVFRYLIQSLDETFANLPFNTKYGKRRLKVDLTFLEKSLLGLKFDTEDMVNVVTLKINTILTAKGSVKEEDA